MNLPGFSVSRPILTTMVMLIVVVLGTVSYTRLKIDLLPNIELPTVSVRTSYDGASPEVVERQVTQVIESIVSRVPGVQEITSSSAEGRSEVRIGFSWGTDVNSAAIDVQSQLEAQINELPAAADRPRVRKFDVQGFAVVMLGISSNLDPIELTDIIENQLQHRFARVPGVAQLDIFSGYNREIRIELDPQRVMALGLPLDRVLQALRDSNLDLPTGRIEAGRYEVVLRAPAQFTSLDEIRNTALRTRDGGSVTIGQIAQVRDTFQRPSRLVRVNGERGVRVAIRKEADANTVEVSRGVLREIQTINQDFPQIRIIATSDQGNFIERSIANVSRSVLYGGGLAILVLLFFLRSARSTVVISLAIPISIIATFAVMYFGGFTLNLMTLGGLALGVGMMVDSSIVVLENIYRRQREHKEPPAVAAAEGGREVSSAIVASTITTLVIFLPLVFMQGVTGMLFRELGYVIAFSLICSLVVSLSLVPMLSSKILRPRDEAEPEIPGLVGRLGAMAGRGFARLESGYRVLLSRTLDHGRAAVLTAVGIVAGSLLLFPMIGTDFLPPSDEGSVRVTGEMEVGTRIELIDQQSQLLESMIYPLVPEAVNALVSIQENEAEVRLQLVPATQRRRSNVEIADDLRRRLTGQIPGMLIRTRAPQGQFLLERLLRGGDSLAVEITGHDLDVLQALTARVADGIADVPGITDVRASFLQGMPQESLSIDRDKVADVGLSVRNVSEVLRTAIAGSRAGEFQQHGNAYRILVQLKDAERLSIDEVLDLTLTTPSGEAVALRNVVVTNSGRAPLQIYRKNQQRQVNVRANVSGRALGDVAADVDRRIDMIPRPAAYTLTVAGTFEEQQRAFRDLLLSLGLAVSLVYMVLACQYESLRNPLVVMFSVPMAIVGVLLTLFLTGTTLNLQSGIGCVMLGGIVVNNAILLVDQSNKLQRAGMAVRDAVMEAGRRRLRPILMTSLTTIIGLFPLALGIGEGADAQAPLARAVVGGLAGSTIITLLLTPVIYTMFHPEKREEEVAAAVAERSY